MVEDNIPLEVRADGKLGCKLTETNGFTQFCTANRTDCQYIEQGMIYNTEAGDFYICTLNFNSWPFQIRPGRQIQNEV